MAEPIASIKQGKLKGVTGTDLNGESYYKFLGIPYAKAPIGPLRFKAPQPAESWNGIRDASEIGNPCLAMDLLSKEITGFEDCLYLNVFTKQLPRVGLSPKPVMVFIHGGGFTMGSGSEQMHGSEYLIAEDVVLVTINYRLGIFGFLSSDDLSLDIPGNAGLKDQTFALKWIQENISSFNGDPNNVTIFGISAGGASVHFQVLSQTAQGLFHKAIAQSGSALNPWAWGQKNIIQVVKQLGQKASNDKEALDILMNTPAHELYEASLKIPDVIFNTLNRRPFGPVLEKPHPTAFLSENPTDLLKSGKFNNVPLIHGVTSNEGSSFELGRDTFFGSLDTSKIGMYWGLGLKEESRGYAEIKAKLNNLYFKDGKTADADYQVVGDVNFAVGVVESTKLAARTSHSPVYLYLFSYKIAMGNNLLKSMSSGKKDFKGVTHGGDQMFLFSGSWFPEDKTKIDPKDLEDKLLGVKKITKIWADFARTGRPHELWEPVTDADELKYFELSQDSKLKINPFPERIAIWDDVFKEVSSFDARIQETSTL